MAALPLSLLAAALLGARDAPALTLAAGAVGPAFTGAIPQYPRVRRGQAVGAAVARPPPFAPFYSLPFPVPRS